MPKVKKTFEEWCIENNKTNYISCWSKKNNFKPCDVSHGSNQHAIFECPICGWETIKVIHDIKKLKDFHCYECEKKEKESLKEQMKAEKIKSKKLKEKVSTTTKQKKKTKKEILQEMMQQPIEKQYLMIDVETNGTQSKNDDLLEIAIYRPDTKTMFHKYLPLTKQKKVLTTQYNGITKAKLKGATHMTEEDVEMLINDFEIDKRTLLHYGTLDAPFVKQYMKEHNLPKRSVLKFYNFKKQIISSPFANREIDGGISKDNLCNMYGISGVLETHDCQNDCILQWQLFEKMYGKTLLITKKEVYNVPNNSNYLVPSSFLDYSRIQNILKNPLPNITTEPDLITSLRLYNCLPSIREEFGLAAVGMMVEHQINCLLNAKKYDNIQLFLENKKNLIYEGTLQGIDDNSLPTTFNQDGSLTIQKNDKITMETQNKLQKILDKELNKLRQKLSEHFIPFLKETIFHNQHVYSQEVVINKEDRIMSQCDLSSEDIICEIKNTQYHIDYYKYQLWYQQHSQQLERTENKSTKTRELYAIVISYLEHNPTITNIILYKIDFSIYNTSAEANRASHWLRM